MDPIFRLDPHELYDIIHAPVRSMYKDFGTYQAVASRLELRGLREVLSRLFPVIIHDDQTQEDTDFKHL
ncbi:MAG: hypothetical protein U1C51_02620 [Candidatus Izemoplasmatales bacterium]|jgi:hypothetical protein|nr:hypothetical protein [bacterium]MDZ4196125.1 hypothetical protein [Candidatus Izemoplasmatales bacterium]